MAAAYYLKFTDSRFEIRGNSQDPDHPGWIDIITYNVGPTASSTGLKDATDISFTLRADDVWVARDLHHALVTGLRYDRAILHLVIGGDYWWDFRKVAVAAYETGHDGTETIAQLSMTFESVQYHIGTPVVAGAAAALVASVRDAATAAARHMLRLHKITSARKK